MTVWEFKIVPAPRRGAKSKGAKTSEDRFALALEELMNGFGAQGWEYLRAESLPVEERKGWLSKTTVTTAQVLVFRRPKALPAAQVPSAAASVPPSVAAAVTAPVAPPSLGPAPSEMPPAVVPLETPKQG